ncbi:NAD(P)-binding domain-containing protein [candidate division KSB1 bacterium]|nr:NAD(P)-binding domain-containing protein [candidate division KSB1 bacterium]
MKIGVIGSGIVGQTLAAGFLKYNHEVMVGTRNVAKLEEWQSQHENAHLGSFADASNFGELIVLAAKGSAAINALELAGENNLKEKTIMDATNPLADAAPENGVLKFFTNLDKSLMETLQEKFPQAHFVKAFSCIGAPFMVNPDFGAQKPAMFICGNNSEAKSEASKIIDKFGFSVEDMGNVEAARAIEPLCILWCIPGLTQNNWQHAFALLKK